MASLLIMLAVLATPAFGQLAAAGGQQATETQVSDSVSASARIISGGFGHVEIVQGDGTFYADEVEIFQDRDHAIATGNVVLSQGNNRIAAERAEFNAKTLLGTFFKAWGIATLQPPRQTRAAGIAPPTLVGAETDVYFFGETVEKIGPRKYQDHQRRVQHVRAAHAPLGVVVIDRGGERRSLHAVAKRRLQRERRAVALHADPLLSNQTARTAPRAFSSRLMVYRRYADSRFRTHSSGPSAGARMQRSCHDWFSNTGQGVGTEYRYNLAPGLGRRDQDVPAAGEGTASADPNGGVTTERSYEIRGTANQLLPYGFRARGRVDYFSNVTTMQPRSTPTSTTCPATSGSTAATSSA